MAEISAAAVKALRERTGLPLMDCKAALVEGGGDEEKPEPSERGFAIRSFFAKLNPFFTQNRNRLFLIATPLD